MESANRDQPHSLSLDEGEESVPITFPAPGLFSLGHAEAPGFTGSASPSQPDPTHQGVDTWDTHHFSARRRGRSASVNSIDDVGSSHPRKKIHLSNSSDLADDRQDPIAQQSSLWHGGQIPLSDPPGQSQTHALDKQLQDHTQTNSYQFIPVVTSSTVHDGLSMQGPMASIDFQAASSISSSSFQPSTSAGSLPVAHGLKNIHHETEIDDCNTTAPRPHSRSSANETQLRTDAFSNLSALKERLRIADAQDLSQLPRTEAIKVLDQIYINLQNHAPGSIEYPHVLRLLQDCSSHAGALPTQLRVQNVRFSRSQFLNRGGEAMLYRGRMDGHDIVVREPVIPAGDWKAPRGYETIQRVHREAIIHSQLRHPNILPFLGVHHEGPNPSPLVILPFHPRGSLQKLLADLEPGGLVKQSDLIKIIVGSARGMVYLHSRTPPIIHGDLHPGNILLDDGTNPILCDFGLSRIQYEISRIHSMREEGGRIRFVAPELYDSSANQFSSSQGSDVFALAMTFLNTWSSQQPFYEIKSDMQVASRLIQGLRPREPLGAVALDPKIKDKFWNLLETMWTHEVSKRPSSNMVQMELEHIFSHFQDSFPMAQTHIQSFNPHRSSIQDMVQPLPNLLEVRQPPQMLGPHDDLQHLQYAQGADQLLWNHKPENICLPGTRTAILNAIINWVKGGTQLPECP
ncbi:kinase-like protein, partial [Clavulina sp. PMI_390]